MIQGLLRRLFPSKPYATVILPTFNRFSTLPYAITSVQNQTVRNIEILIVLDGAIKACREIALKAASHDHRIRVLDLPKAPGSGEKNVHHAVLSAQAEWVFYIDDDDLFLKDHIDVLGKILEHNDIADTRVASASRDFKLHLAPTAPSNPTMKRLLVEYKFKNLFDTHIAHTRQAYTKYAQWIPKSGEGGRPVWDFLAGFAKARACKWTSSEKITALSLHGSNRRDMTSEMRSNEIGTWSKIIQSPRRFEEILKQANSVYHFFRLMSSDPPGNQDFKSYVQERSGYPGIISNTQLNNLFAIKIGRKIDRRSALFLAKELSHPGFVGYPITQIADLFQSCFGVDYSLQLFEDLSKIPGNHVTGAYAISAHYHLKAGNMDRARHLFRLAVKMGPDPIDQLSSILNQLKGS